MITRSAAVRSMLRIMTASAAALLAGGIASAATFPDLHTVTVIPGPDAAANRRTVSERLAMTQLLTRVTGRREAAGAPELAHLVENARAYVSRWGEIDRERVFVGFNAAAVESELERASWPVWGAERPLTLVWIAVDFGDGQRALMGESLATAEWSPELAELMLELREQLDEAARERGLPVAYPLLDLEDFSAVSFAEIWGGFDGLITAASARYGADAILVGRIGVTSLGLDVRWSALRDGRGSAVLGTDVRGGLEWLADQYAAEYATIGGARSTHIAVLDVTSFEQYASVMSHLESLSVLQSVDVEALEGSVLRLRVAARGEDSVVERLLTLGGVLVPAARAPGGPVLPAESLVFRVADALAGR